MPNNNDSDPNIAIRGVFGDRDVSDIQVSVGVLETKVDNLEKNKSDKSDLEKLKSEWYRYAASLVLPLATAVVSAIIIVALR